MKIQPIDVDSESQALKDPIIRPESTKPVLKSRLKRLFDRQFPSVLRISSAERQTAVEYTTKDAGTGPEFEPSYCVHGRHQILETPSNPANLRTLSDSLSFFRSAWGFKGFDFRGVTLFNFAS